MEGEDKRTDLQVVSDTLQIGTEIVPIEKFPDTLKAKIKEVCKNIGYEQLFLVETVKDGRFQFMVVKEGSSRRLVTWVGLFHLTRLPGCCGVMVHRDFATSGSYLHCGLGTLMNMFAQWRACTAGYTLLLATDTPYVDPKQYSDKIFKEQGWEAQGIPDFVNKRTKNSVRIYYKDRLDEIMYGKPRLQVEAAQEGT